MEILQLVLNLILGILILFYVLRIVMSWDPRIPLKQFPWVIIYLPTEPLLLLLRRLVPPLGGVDITPVLGVGLFSLMREMLLGQQGILTMLERLSP